MLLIKNKRLRMIVGGLEALNLLAIKLWFRNPGRARTLFGMMFRDYMSLVGREKWVSRDLHDLFPEMGSQRCVMEHARGNGIFTPVDELAYLALITSLLQPRNIFEIGTFRGRTALNFALNSPPDCHVYTLDLPVPEREAFCQRACTMDAGIIRCSETGVDYRGKDVEPKIKQLFGNSLSFDYTPYLGRMDLVFVDGAHHYEAVVQDSRNALKLIKPGGVVIWHDFGNYGDYNDVTRAVVENVPPGEVVQIGNSQLAVYRSQGTPGVTA